MPNYFMTLEDIRKNEPCAEGWTKLLKYLGASKASRAELKATPVSLHTILNSNGLFDALWTLQCVPGITDLKPYKELFYSLLTKGETAINPTSALNPGTFKHWAIIACFPENYSEHWVKENAAQIADFYQILCAPEMIAVEKEELKVLNYTALNARCSVRVLHNIATDHQQVSEKGVHYWGQYIPDIAYFRVRVALNGTSIPALSDMPIPQDILDIFTQWLAKPL